MRIVMMGTGPFAVPTFESLHQAGHEIPMLITRPVPPSTGRSKSEENPMRAAAERLGIPVSAPANINSPDAVQQLRELRADLFVVCDFGQILSREALGMARLGGINLHASLLPKYRGAAPINWAIYHGDSVTGVTVIHMTPKLDGGPNLVQVEVPIDPQQTTASLEPVLAHAGVDAVHQAIAMLSTWDGVSPMGKIQDPSLATKAPRLKKEDGQVNWNLTAQQISDQIRAFQPWPGTFTTFSKHGKSPERLILLAAHAPNEPKGDLPPGTIFICNKQQLGIQAGKGSVLMLDVVQPAGKRPMSIEEFLRGNALEQGHPL
jgi:methionyl-tRNA formyltransferase